MVEVGRPLEVVPPPLKAFRRDGLGYIYEPPNCPVRFRMDYLSERADSITGEIVVESSVDGRANHIHQGRLNLDSTNGKRDLATYLQKIDGEVPWRQLLETFAAGILKAERVGEPFIKAGRLPQRMVPAPLVEKLLPALKPTSIFGPGGSGKGYIATGIAVHHNLGIPFVGLKVQKGRTLYLDWEDDVEEFDMRVKEVAAGLNLESVPEIDYRVCRSPLRHQAHQIARYVSENGITLVVVDSVEAAAGTAGEGRSYEDSAKSFFAALRQLGRVTVLLIDHVSSQSRKGEDTGPAKAYGSIFKENWCRSTWEMRKDQKPGERMSQVALYHTKVNRGLLNNPIGILLDFTTEGAVMFRPCDPKTSEKLASKLSLADRIEAHLLANGPAAVVTLEDGLREPDNKIRAILTHKLYKDRFRHLQDGRWDVVERGEDDIPF